MLIKVMLHSPLAQMLGLIKLMRPKQWVKNGFILAPLVFTGAFLDARAVSYALLAVLLFCVASSATYIINDIHDIERDRRHPKKSKTRPLAAGMVPVPTALILLALSTVIRSRLSSVLSRLQLLFTLPRRTL
jgi:4-hydroxybenzoate polyprenyltransferase